jgi:hypothetical protein
LKTLNDRDIVLEKAFDSRQVLAEDFFRNSKHFVYEMKTAELYKFRLSNTLPPQPSRAWIATAHVENLCDGRSNFCGIFPGVFGPELQVCLGKISGGQG